MRKARGEWPATGALATLVERLFADARAWSTERRREHANSAIGVQWAERFAVRDFGRQLHRPVRPFQLRITELPVAGTTSWRLSGHHVVVSTLLRSDQTAYQRWLNVLLGEIA